MTLLKMIADQDRNLLFVGSVQLTQDNRDGDVYEGSTARIALPCHGCLCSATKCLEKRAVPQCGTGMTKLMLHGSRVANWQDSTVSNPRHLLDIWLRGN